MPHAAPDIIQPAKPPMRPLPLAPDLASRWMLDRSVDFLNHGSFGAMPKVVAAEQERWRGAIEANPIEMLGRRGRELLAPAAQAVARFVGAEADDVAFVTNATGGINAVLRSMTLGAGDELLTTNHVYNAVRQTMKFVAERHGARYVEVPLNVPLRGANDARDAIVAAITPRTRVVVVDHISSPTAIVFPVDQIARECAARNVGLLVDGAHAPGTIPLDLGALAGAGATWYSANLHKWVCAPKGCAFLWTRRDRQSTVHPTTISHFLGEGYRREFDWQGTRDITPWLSVRAALAFMDDEAIGLGWARVLAHNHALATWVQAHLCAAWDVEPLSPLDGSMLGSMATVRLPAPLQPGRSRFETFEQLQRVFFDRFRVEVPVVQWGGAWFVRPCCQVYNRAEQYERLAEVVAALRAEN
ncbi:MAG: aminotransferase class V-fold PLP-dependent enzyme [Phycisphaerales bacterium]